MRNPPKPSHKRRVFMNKGDTHCQLFSFKQDPDGSVYCSLPEFSNTKFMVFQNNNGKLELGITDPLEQEGKISFHGTGMSTFRVNTNTKGHRCVQWGNHLFDEKNAKIGTRHLFTVFFQEPEYTPDSKAFNRETDYVLNAEKLQPFAMVFFAVPGKPLREVHISANFNADDLETIPPETGFGGFGLRYHNIAWFYYRTKNMDRWPKHTHFCYYDGFSIPMFIGTETGEGRIELRHPQYSINQNILSIGI